MLVSVVLLRRLSALLLCLGLTIGGAAVCAGWTATPDARMACCAGADCPMHEGDPEAAPSAHALTQSQADACCALSERNDSDASSPTTVVSLAAPVLEAGVVALPRTPAPLLSERWRADASGLAPPVPRHILLSVFLV